MEAIKKHPYLTAVELSRKLGRMDPNYVRPRIHELTKLGLIREADKRPCTITNKTVLTFVVA